MMIHKAQIIVAADVHEIHMCDVIEHAGQFWLVPEWFDSPDGLVTRPERIVSLATMEHQRTKGIVVEFVVNNPIPKSVLFGQPSPEEACKYGVVAFPEIIIPTRRGLH